MRLRDISGKKFNRLTPVEHIPNKGWMCRCDCGNVHGPLESYLITKGKVKSCGCLVIDILRARNPALGKMLSKPKTDISGMRFGRLTVVKYSGSGKWECVCDCGKTTFTPTCVIKSGKAKSCGCYAQDKFSEFARSLKKTDEELKIAYRTRNDRYYSANRDKIIARSKKWKKENKEKLAACARERHEYRVKHDPCYVERQRVYGRTYYRTESGRAAAKRKASIRRGIHPIPDLQWTMLCKLWEGRCSYCGILCVQTKDHIIPVSRGGDESLMNVAPACSSCNTKKSFLSLSVWSNRTGLCESDFLNKVSEFAKVVIKGTENE